MVAGLQVFNAAGALVGDHTTNYGRFLGMVWTGSYPSNAFYDSALLDGRPWYVRISPPGAPYGPLYDAIQIGISSGTIYWGWPSGGKRNCWIQYGVY